MKDADPAAARTPLKTLEFWPPAVVAKLDNPVMLIHTAEQVINICRGPNGAKHLAMVTDLREDTVALLVTISQAVLSGMISREDAKIRVAAGIRPGELV